RATITWAGAFGKGSAATGGFSDNRKKSTSPALADLPLACPSRTRFLPRAFTASDGAEASAVGRGEGPRQEPRPAGTGQGQVGQGRGRGFLPVVGETAGRRRALPEGSRPGDRRP